MKRLLSFVAVFSIGSSLLSNVVALGNTALNNIESGAVYEATGDVIDDMIYGAMDLMRGEGVELSSITDGIGDIASSIFSSNSYRRNGSGRQVPGSYVTGFTSTGTKGIEGFH